MKQTNGTYEVADGVLMADQDRCISIANCRVIIQPLSQQPIIPRVEVTVQARQKSRMEMAFDTCCHIGVCIVALYLLGEVAYAFWIGAVAKAVR